MTMRRKVATIRRTKLQGPHQGLRLCLAADLVPGDVLSTALAAAGAVRDYVDLVDAECRARHPVLDAWGTQMERVDVPLPDGDERMTDAEWDALHLLPLPEPSRAVLDEAHAAVRAWEARGEPDDLERDTLAAAAYLGHLALALSLPFHQLQNRAHAAGRPYVPG